MMMNQLEFLELCSIGDIENVRAALSRNLVDAKFSHSVNGWTALHWAAKRGHIEIVRLLLAVGFDPSTRNADGKRPIDLTTTPHVEYLFISHGMTCEDGAGISQPDAQARRDENTARFVPSYLRHPPFPHSNGNLPTIAQNTSHSDTSKENGSISGNGSDIYNGSTNSNSGKAKFILIRTSVQDGKEAFKRFTLPGNGSFEFFKALIEKEMNRGRIAAILTLPDMVLVETAEQLAELDNMQKVEIVFANQKDDSQGSKAKNGTLLIQKFGVEVASALPTHFLPLAIFLMSLATVGGFVAFRRWK